MAKVKVRLGNGIPSVSIAGPKTSFMMIAGETAEVDKEFFLSHLQGIAYIVPEEVLNFVPRHRKREKKTIVGEK